MLAAGVLAAACSSRSPTAPTAPTGASPQPVTVAIMGAARLTPEQLVAWFNARQPATGSFAATVPVVTLTSYFVEEGADEGVRGDVAFMQSVVETGWFRFNGVVRASANNFAGIGATDTNPSPATFPDARTGVRAQIQHLRAYADATALTCTAPPLAHACVDPRFQLVIPKGKAPSWNQMGNGNWATAPTYASSILALYNDALAFIGATAVSRAAIHGAVTLPQPAAIAARALTRDPPSTILHARGSYVSPCAGDYFASHSTLPSSRWRSIARTQCLTLVLQPVTLRHRADGVGHVREQLRSRVS